MSAVELVSLADVQRYARGSLNAAGVGDVYPVPIDQVAAAAGLHPARDLYALGDDVPPGIRAIMSKMARKVVGAFDLRERQVYLDMSVAEYRLRFIEGHETGHALLPWHQGAYMGDDHTTLAPDTRDVLEAEANAFSAELLFAGDGFTRRADDSSPGLGRPLELAENYGTSAHAALRRYAERSRHEVALLVLGRYPVWGAGGESALKVLLRQCAQSPAFDSRNGPIASLVPTAITSAFGDAITLASNATCGVMPGSGTVRVPDRRRGGYTDFVGEVFANGRLRFLLLHRKPRFAGRRVHVVTA